VRPIEINREGPSRRALLQGTLASAMLAASPAWSQEPDGAVQARVDDYLQRLSGFGYSGATLLVSHGEVVLRAGYGLANEADDTPITPETVFDICSMSKTFTAVAALRLSAQGRLRLDDPISRHLPGVPQDKRAITIEQLLSHTGGLERDFPYAEPTAEDYEVVGREEALRRIFAMDLIGAPGEDFAYSNNGYMLAAAIVESAAGRPFQDFIASEIFTPLGLRDTGFWEARPTIPDSRLARSYHCDLTELTNIPIRSGATWADLGGGRIVSTVDDIHAWLEALRGGDFLPAELRDRMWTRVKGNYGLGWQIDEGPGGHRIHHGGDGYGFGAELAFYPEHDLVLANLVNRRNDVLGARYAADRVVPLIALGQTPRIFSYQTTFDLPPSWTPRIALLDRAVGDFRLATGGVLTVRKMSDDAYQLFAVGQDAIDTIMPATADDRAMRARDSERAIQLLRDAIVGDEAAMAPTLREGAPVSVYRESLAGQASDPEMGNLISIDAVGTALWDYPVGSRLTSLKLRFERGERYLRFGWNADDRVMYWGLEGPERFGGIPLRDGGGSRIVAWSMITGRSLQLRLEGRRRIAIATSDGAEASAARIA
jgi:CubicO group peptidase (beta-lactamase class C family)